MAGGTRIAALEASGAQDFYHADHLGSTRAKTDSSGANNETIDYVPFGETTAPTSEAYKFTGKEEDPETSLYYYGARYYDPQLGRFISADTVVQAPNDPQTLNRYSYCRNNPLSYTDPTGHSFWGDVGDFFKSVFTGIVGAAVTVLTGGNVMMGGMAAGMVSGAMTGKLENVVMGACTGGLAGGLGSMVPAPIMLAGGAAYSGATGGVKGLANFAGSIGGGVAGDYMVTQWSGQKGSVEVKGDSTELDKGTAEFKKCIGQARVLKGNADLIGKEGAFPGVEIDDDSAAVIPSQWGGKRVLSSHLDEISGVIGDGKASFSNVADVVGGDPPKGYKGWPVREALMHLTNYDKLIIELPGLSKDLGVQQITITVPASMNCPDCTRQVR